MTETEARGGRTGERPTAPHLQIYRWSIPMALSILHRMTGAALGIGTLLLAWWIVALSMGPGPFAQANAVLGSPLGQLLLFGFCFALILHLLNGIRHLVWDAGFGLAVPTARATGWIVVIAAVVLTVVTWFYGLDALGGRP